MTTQLTPEAAPLKLRQVHDRHFWAQPGDEPHRTFILRFSDPDCREQVFTGEDAEERAIAAWNLYSPSWNIYLFGTMPCAPEVDASDSQAAENAALRQQLAEASGWRETLGQVIADTAQELECEPDNEAILQAVADKNTQLAEAREALESVLPYAQMGEYLVEKRSYNYGDGRNEPREYGVSWDWQQRSPDDAPDLHGDAMEWIKETVESADPDAPEEAYTPASHRAASALATLKGAGHDD